MKYYTYFEYTDIADIQITISEEYMIKKQRAAALQVNKSWIYANDGQALLDFIAIHWCTECD